MHKDGLFGIIFTLAIDCGIHLLLMILSGRDAWPGRNASTSKSNGILPLTSVRKKEGMAPPEPPKHHRRLEKSITGHRTRVDVISRVPRPAFMAAVISSSLLRRDGVTPLFQWNTCRFQAPPLY